VHEAIAAHLDSVNGSMNLELGTVMNHFWFSEINISPLMVQKICTSFIVPTAEHEMRPFLVQKRLLHLSYTSVKPGAYNAHKYMHGSTVGLLISKVHGLLKFPRFQPIGSMRTVLIKTLRYC
jgi:hypothetical protein